VLDDYYALTTIDSLGHESLKTSYRRPIDATGAICVIEGIIMDLQGKRVPNAAIMATPQVPPEDLGSSINNISTDTITEYSGPDGRFSLPLLQGALVRLEIPAIALARNISVPKCTYALINDIRIDLLYRYPLNTGL
jgi:hypothetical protein